MKSAFKVGHTFTVKRGDFEQYRFGKKDVELRAIEKPWRNAHVGDVAAIRCGRKMFRKRIVGVHCGGLARIFLRVDYKRVFPRALTVFDAVRLAKKLIPYQREYVAFELKDFV